MRLDSNMTGMITSEYLQRFDTSPRSMEALKEKIGDQQRECKHLQDSIEASKRDVLDLRKRLKTHTSEDLLQQFQQANDSYKLLDHEIKKNQKKLNEMQVVLKDVKDPDSQDIEWLFQMVRIGLVHLRNINDYLELYNLLIKDINLSLDGHPRFVGIQYEVDSSAARPGKAAHLRTNNTLFENYFSASGQPEESKNDSAVLFPDEPPRKNRWGSS